MTTGTHAPGPFRRKVGIVGSGFSGLGAAIQLRRAGYDDLVVFERGSDVGGTWRDNTYPGCQCDVPSHLYSFSFRPNPEWSRTYSPQAEIWAYLRRCAREAGVVPHILFDHPVTGARWDDAEGAWVVVTPRGTYVVENLILANGGLAEPRLPEVPGLDRFRGSVMHSAAWDHSVGLSGKRIAVIGTGASAIQIVPHLQRTAEELFVFQRTPAWVLPHTDRPIGSAERALYRRFPVVQRLLRKTIYLTRELLVLGLTKERRLLRPLAALARRQIRRNVADPELQRKLMPSYELGCKRILLSDHFYPAVAAPNARLVTEPIAAFSERFIITQDGQEREVDAVVFATGFRVTDNPVMELVVGREGESLASSWRATGMRAYLGTTVNGFPNLFIMTGPNTGIGHTSLLIMAEAQIAYILEALKFKERSHVRRLEVRAEAVEKFTDEVQSKMKGTVWTMGGCASWYLDDHGRNTTLWPDHTWRFRRLTKRFDPAAYLVDRPTDRNLEGAVSI